MKNHLMRALVVFTASVLFAVTAGTAQGAKPTAGSAPSVLRVVNWSGKDTERGRNGLRRCFAR